jgi:hypothetical protein
MWSFTIMHHFYHVLTSTESLWILKPALAWFHLLWDTAFNNTTCHKWVATCSRYATCYCSILPDAFVSLLPDSRW